MTDSGRALKPIILKLINNMKVFDEEAQKETDSIVKDASELSESWDDPQFEEFYSYTEELVRKLSVDRELLREIIVNLERIANKF